MVGRSGGYPLLQEALYTVAAVVIARRFDTAAASLAAIFDRRKLGMAMAAMIKRIATTTSNSIRVKPRWLRACRLICSALVSMLMALFFFLISAKKKGGTG